MSEQNKKDVNDTHEGSMGTDRNPPSGTEHLERPVITDEEKLKKRIEELRKRDPFVYR